MDNLFSRFSKICNLVCGGNSSEWQPYDGGEMGKDEEKSSMVEEENAKRKSKGKMVLCKRPRSRRIMETESG